MSETPAEYTTKIIDSGDPYFTKRIIVGTASTGLKRDEWVGARYGQLIPCNWSNVTFQPFLNSFMPLRYQVDDAQNIIVKECIDGNYEWCLLYEHDVIPPPDCFVRLNQYMIEKKIPVVSGLYYTRSRPSEPLVYRGRGNSYYGEWNLGDKVWADGIPTGLLLIHSSILKTMWDESPEYQAGRYGITRRVFETPRKLWFDPQIQIANMLSGTSDLFWCDRVMKDNIFEKAGWKDFCPDMKYPFLVDTNIFCRHIDPDGAQYP